MARRKTQAGGAAAKAAIGEHTEKRDAKPLPPPELHAGYARTVDHVFEISPWESFEDLERDLKVEDNLHPERIRASLNTAEANALEAHRLYVTARVEFAEYETSQTRYLAPMRDAAVVDLEADKASGKRTKQITDADVESRMVALYPEQIADVRNKRNKAKRTMDQIQRLADMWKQRSSSLRAMLGGTRL